MAIYGFSDRQTAERCKALAKSQSKNAVSLPTLLDNGGRVFLVSPSADIPASILEGFGENIRSQPGKGIARVYEILHTSSDPDGVEKLHPRQLANSVTLEKTVYNYTSEIVRKNTFLFAVEDSFGKLVLIPHSVSSLVQTLPQFESPNTQKSVSVCMERDTVNGLIMTNDFAAQKIYGDVPFSVSNPLQIPSGRPAILAHVNLIGTVAVSAAPMLQIPCSFAVERGDVLEYPHDSRCLYVVQTPRLASNSSRELNYATVLPLLPYGEAEPKYVIGDAPYLEIDGYSSFYYDETNRQMVRGYGPYWHRDNLWHFATRAVLSGFAVIHDGHAAISSASSVSLTIPLDTASSMSSSFTWDIYEGDPITALLTLNCDAHLAVPTVTLISGPFDFRPGTVMYFPHGAGRGWEPWILPQAYRISSPQIVVPSLTTTSGQSGDQQFEYIPTSGTSNLAVVQCGGYYVKTQSAFMS